MNDHNPYIDRQHGFCRHKCFVTQLLHVVEDLSDILDCGLRLNMHAQCMEPRTEP